MTEGFDLVSAVYDLLDDVILVCCWCYCSCLLYTIPVYRTCSVSVYDPPTALDNLSMFAV